MITNDGWKIVNDFWHSKRKSLCEKIRIRDAKWSRGILNETKWPWKTREYVKQPRIRLGDSEGFLNDLERPQITRRDFQMFSRDLWALRIILKDPNRRQKVSLSRERDFYLPCIPALHASTSTFCNTRRLIKVNFMIITTSYGLYTQFH